jgi:hypothetical protein
VEPLFTDDDGVAVLSYAFAPASAFETDLP